MSHSLRYLACTALLLLSACNGSSPAGPLFPHEPIDNVQTVIAGRVLDSAGAPLAGALVDVTVDCSSDTNPECRVGSNRATDSEGQFVVWIDQDFHVEFPVKAEVRAWPPVGMGYVLGTSRVRNLDAAFQRTPAADTTFVDVVLPPNTVESRRPVRIAEVGHRTSRLALDARRLYMSSPSGVTAVDQATGECLWQEGSTSGLAGPPYALGAGIVVLSPREGTLMGVGAVDGHVLWRRDGVATRSLTAGDGGEVFASDGRNLAAYDLATGATLWSQELIGSGNVEIAADEGLVCAEILAYVECWEPSTGEHVWSAATDFADWVAIAQGRVIVGGQSGFTALNGGSGEVLWRAAVATFNPPAIAENGAYLFACTSADCLAVRTSDGNLAWRTAVPGPRSPATDGEAVYVVGGLGNSAFLHVLDAGTGAIRERILPDPFDGGGFGGTPVVGDELVFVFGGFGHLYVFEKS